MNRTNNSESLLTRKLSLISLLIFAVTLLMLGAYNLIDELLDIVFYLTITIAGWALSHIALARLKEEIIYIDQEILDNTNEILQHEIIIWDLKCDLPIAATPNILNCIAFYGFDVKNKIGFLCHLDTPTFKCFSEQKGKVCSMDSLPVVFNLLKNRVRSLNEHHFECFIVGGVSARCDALLAQEKRNRVIKQVKQEISCKNGLNLSLPTDLGTNGFNQGYEQGLYIDLRGTSIEELKHKPYPRTYQLKKGTCKEAHRKGKAGVIVSPRFKKVPSEYQDNRNE